MPVAFNAVTVALTNLGNGETVLDLPPEDIYTPDPRIANANNISAQNVRLLDSIAAIRPGYASLGTAPNTNRVTGLYFAVFDDGTTNLVRATKSTLHSLNSGTYTDRSGAATFTSVTDTDYWAFAMVRRTGTVSPKNEVFASDGVNVIKAWPGTGNFADVAGSPAGAKVIVPFLGRAFCMNHITSGNRHHSRITHSVVGDPRTYTGVGSGSVDLDEDPYPINAGSVMSGGIVALKGSAEGGAIYRGTATGLSSQPIRWDAINRDEGVGILLRRSFLLISPGVAFFFAHDGFTLWDGVRGFRKVAPGVTRTLLRRINYDALDAAHAWYKPTTHEIKLAIPTGDAVPSEVWTYNYRENRVYGPDIYGHDLTASSVFVESGAFQWGDPGDGAGSMDYPGGWSTIPYSSWGEIGGQQGSITTALGATDGGVRNDRDNPADDDDGMPITGSYVTGDIRAVDRIVRLSNGATVPLSHTDILTLRDITITYQASAAWTPAVQVSTDGGATWTTISDGVAVAAGTGTLETVTYYTNIVGKRHRIRINASALFLYSLVLNFQHAGDVRHG